MVTIEQIEKVFDHLILDPINNIAPNIFSSKMHFNIGSKLKNRFIFSTSKNSFDQTEDIYLFTDDRIQIRIKFIEDDNYISFHCNYLTQNHTFEQYIPLALFKLYDQDNNLKQQLKDFIQAYRNNEPISDLVDNLEKEITDGTD